MKEFKLIHSILTYVFRPTIFYSTIIDHDGSINAQRIMICDVLQNWLKKDVQSILDRMEICVLFDFYGCVDVVDNVQSVSNELDDDDNEETAVTQPVVDQDVFGMQKLFDSNLKLFHR